MTKEEWADWYEERAAILEYDAGLSRAEAERIAEKLVNQMQREENNG